MRLPLGSFRIGPPPTDPPGPSPPTPGRGGWPLAILLAATFAVRAIHPDQPIVENYVGRQIPTAMVARNLERGSGFLRPELDTGPFPNLFLVEPPIFEQVVSSVRSILGFVREPAGRLVSAVAVALGGWGLFGLARRRDGRTVALLAVAAFAAFPVMIRYGRAFQPDALMLGLVLAGLRGWDEFATTGDRRWAAFGGWVLATGLALKITSAWVLIPFVMMVRRWPISWRLAAGGAMLIPGFAWYACAWGHVARPSAGSLASSDNAAIWIRTLDPSSWLHLSTWSNLGWSMVVRSFTPVGFALAILGFCGTRSRTTAMNPDSSRSPRAGAGDLTTENTEASERGPGTSRDVFWKFSPLCDRRGRREDAGPRGHDGSSGQSRPDRLWVGWAIGCGLAIVGLAAKWHHAYYWMVVAPVAAVGVARGLAGLASRGRPGLLASTALGSSFLALCAAQSVGTWRTPPEWSNVSEACAEVRRLVPADAPLIAREAVLYLADRRGFRLEFDPSAAQRAAGEWGESLDDPEKPLALVDFYRTRGGTTVPSVGAPPRSFQAGYDSPLFVAEVGPILGDARRRAWRAAIRSRPNVKVLVDRPDLLIAEWP